MEHELGLIKRIQKFYRKRFRRKQDSAVQVQRRLRALVVSEELSEELAMLILFVGKDTRGSNDEETKKHGIFESKGFRRIF